MDCQLKKIWIKMIKLSKLSDNIRVMRISSVMCRKHIYNSVMIIESYKIMINVIKLMVPENATK
jgi:hypothetical protein